MIIKLFFTQKIKRRYYLKKYTGTIENPSKDYLVYQEKDHEFYNGVYRSKSGKYIIIWNSSTLVSDYHILSADNPKGEFSSFTPRGVKHEYFIEHHKDKFYIITNLNAQNNRLMETSILNTHVDNWVEIIPNSNENQILDMDIFEKYLVVNVRKNGLSQIRIMNQKTKKDKYLEFNDNAFTTYLSINKEMNTNMLRYVFTSLTQPPSTYDYNMDTGENILLKKQEVIGGYQSEDYESKRLFGISRDGEKVPISLVYRKDLRKKAHKICYFMHMDPMDQQ